MGVDASGEAEGSEESGGLPLPSLGDGKDGEVVGKQGGDGEGEDGGEGEAPAVRAAGVGEMRESGEEIDGREGGHRRLSCLRQGRRHRLHETLLCGRSSL